MLQLLRHDQQFAGDAVGDPVRLRVVESPADPRILRREGDAAVGAAIDVRAEQLRAVLVAQRRGLQHRGILRGEVECDRLLAPLYLRGSSWS